MASEIAIPQSPSVFELLGRLRDVAVPWLQARTVAIMAEKPLGTLNPYGTGIVLAIADDVFLVSAAHVLTRATSPQLWVHPAASGPKMIPLDGVTINTTENRESVAFGFVRLSEEVRSELATVKQFVRLSEIVMNEDDVAGQYAAFGFPAAINSASPYIPVEARPFYYGTKLHDWSSKRPRLDRFDRRLNVALEYAWRNSSDHTGAIAEPPKPEGLSGGGLWRLYAHEHAKQGQWTTDAIRLVGIQHSHVPVKRKWRKNRGPKRTRNSSAPPRGGALLGDSALPCRSYSSTGFPRARPCY